MSGEVLHLPLLVLGEDSQAIVFGQIPHVNEVEHYRHHRRAEEGEGKVDEQRLIANVCGGEEP